MDPTIISGLIGGGASLLGGLFSNSANASAVASTNAMQMQLAQEQMNFQEQMSNTAYQRATADMRAAGINPMLAVTAGGASTPMGAQAQLSAPTFNNPAAGVAQAANSAAGVIGTQANIGLTKAQADQSKSQTNLNDANVGKVVQDTATSAADAQRIAATTAKITGADTDAARASAAASNASAAFSTAAASNEGIKSGIYRANSAKAAAEAEDAKYVGHGFVGDTLGSLARSTGTLGDAAKRDWYDPIANAVSNGWKSLTGSPSSPVPSQMPPSTMVP